MVGGTVPVSRAPMVAMTPVRLAADSECPIMDLVELTGIL